MQKSVWPCPFSFKVFYPQVHQEGATVSLSPSGTSQNVHQSPLALPSVYPGVDPMYSEVENRDREITTPLGIYQTIEDAQTQNGRSEVIRAEITSAPSITSGPTATSVTSGPLSTGSQDDELTNQEPDPNAIYAQVDIEKKRASRKHKKSDYLSPQHQSRWGKL